MLDAPTSLSLPSAAPYPSPVKRVADIVQHHRPLPLKRKIKVPYASESLKLSHPSPLVLAKLLCAWDMVGRQAEGGGFMLLDGFRLAVFIGSLDRGSCETGSCLWIVVRFLYGVGIFMVIYLVRGEREVNLAT